MAKAGPLLTLNKLLKKLASYSVNEPIINRTLRHVTDKITQIAFGSDLKALSMGSEESGRIDQTLWY